MQIGTSLLRLHDGAARWLAAQLLHATARVHAYKLPQQLAASCVSIQLSVQ
jgi:hypothetical protein